MNVGFFAPVEGAALFFFFDDDDDFNSTTGRFWWIFPCGELKSRTRRAAKPQSTMPCNHVTSYLVEFRMVTVKKKKGTVGKNLEHNSVRINAIDLCVIEFVD